MTTGPLLKGQTLLVVEDDADTREVLATGLRLHGARVVEAASAQMGLLAAENERPDVYLVDLEMPELDGFAFLRAVRSLASGVGRRPAIAVTVHNTPEDRTRTLKAGFLLHYPKPVNLDELARMLAAVLGTQQEGDV